MNKSRIILLMMTVGIVAVVLSFALMGKKTSGPIDESGKSLPAIEAATGESISETEVEKIPVSVGPLRFDLPSGWGNYGWKIGNERGDWQETEHYSRGLILDDLNVFFSGENESDGKLDVRCFRSEKDFEETLSAFPDVFGDNLFLDKDSSGLIRSRREGVEASLSFQNGAYVFHDELVIGRGRYSCHLAFDVSSQEETVAEKSIKAWKLVQSSANYREYEEFSSDLVPLAFTYPRHLNRLTVVDATGREDAPKTPKGLALVAFGWKESPSQVSHELVDIACYGVRSSFTETMMQYSELFGNVGAITVNDRGVNKMQTENGAYDIDKTNGDRAFSDSLIVGDDKYVCKIKYIASHLNDDILNEWITDWRKMVQSATFVY